MLPIYIYIKPPSDSVTYADIFFTCAVQSIRGRSILRRKRKPIGDYELHIQSIYYFQIVAEVSSNNAACEGTPSAYKKE